MPDDLTKTGYQDDSRINVNEDYEVRYWSKKFNCTEAELKAAVKKALENHGVPAVKYVKMYV